MSLPKFIARLAHKEFSIGRRMVMTACGGLLFVLTIPALLVWLSTLGSPAWRFSTSPPLAVACSAVAFAGLLLAAWTVWTQVRRGRGTPIPIMATQKLLVAGPYQLCRNPMALGMILLYGGIAVCRASWIAVLAVLLFVVFLVVYLKLVEEKEMALRFGEQYTHYKQSTPFLIPCRLGRSRRSDP
ncbi:MAG: isoprenylcysteine carboxylmethyltransferase family protein [Pirellulales bacterium]|nr:isoprenylcysteine carboxylmethyltransferase family protein [Pirellulales bacterium]